MNLSFLRSSSTSETSKLKWHVLIQALETGQFSAWVAEFPECKVIAESEESAIAALEARLTQQMATVRVVPVQISPVVAPAESPWNKLVGLLKEDENFAEWSDQFWAKKQKSVEDDAILSVEESMEIL